MQTKEFESAIRYGVVSCVEVYPVAGDASGLRWAVRVSTGEEREPERLELTRGGDRTWRTLDAVYAFLAGYVDAVEDFPVYLHW